MNKMFTQPSGPVAKQTNKQAIARTLGIKQKDIGYLSTSTPIDSYSVLFDPETQRTWYRNVASGTPVTWAVVDDKLVLSTEIDTYSLSEARSGDWVNQKLVAREASVIYAIDYGVKVDDTYDSSDALQAIIDRAGSTPIVLPSSFAIKKPIVFRSRTALLGRDNQYSQVKLMAGFVGNSAFVPVSTQQTGTDSAVLAWLNITDLSASNVGSGTDSTKNGIEVTGSFNLTLRGITGVRLNNTIVSGIGTALQHTRRLRIDSLNGSNVNRHIYMPGDGTTRFSYGDIYINDFRTSASCLLPSVIESTDGLQIIGAVIFPNGGLRISGNYIDIVGAHLFEPKAPLGSAETPSGIYIAKRTDAVYSEYVNISGVAIAFAGRLANTTIGNPAQVNNPAPGLYMERVRVFNVQCSVNHSSQESVKLVGCVNGTMNIAARETNTQLLGSGALPAGTYNTLHMENCGEVICHLSDTSQSRNLVVYMDSACVGCMVTGVSGRGAVLGTDVSIPNNTSNRVVMSIDGENSVRSQVDTTPPRFRNVSEVSGSTTPSVTGNINQTVVTFQNSVVTSVTDLPDVGSRKLVLININDNNATRLVDVSNGGKFKTKAGANIMGKGVFLQFIRDPFTGYLVEL